MARAQLGKRPHADDLSQDARPNKKIKSAGELRNFPPEFWDRLSRIPLTRRALRELYIRPIKPGLHDTAARIFAIFEGYDYNYPEPNGVDQIMASSRSASSSRRTKLTKSTNATTAPSGRSSAYDKAFEQHLNDNNIYLHGRKSKPDNSVDLRQIRPSFSPSKFSDGAFEHFQNEHDYLDSEGDVMRKIIPIISGTTNIPNSGEVLFSNLESITDGAAVDVKPDFFDGARFSDIDAKVREDLSTLIIPSDTNAARRPAAPNFFLEAKGPGGGGDVAKRQAGLDGAIGARAMHALQNFGDEEPVFDGNAYSYSSTYHADTGTLQLYRHHVTAPTAPGGRPGYHMNQLDGWQMTGNIDSFRLGASAFRNARDFARGHRDQFIQAANLRARQPRPETPAEAEITVAESQQYEDSSCEKIIDGEDYVRDPQAVGTRDHASSEGFDDGLAPPQDLYSGGEEPSPDSTSAAAELTRSFATSVTSNPSAHGKNHSKRNRASNSPPSNALPNKRYDSTKRRVRESTTRRAAGSSAGASTSAGSASSSRH